MARTTELPIHLLDAGRKTYCGIIFKHARFRSTDTTTFDEWVTCEKCAAERRKRINKELEDETKPQHKPGKYHEEYRPRGRFILKPELVG